MRHESSQTSGPVESAIGNEGGYVLRGYVMVMRSCVARYPALCTQEGGELTFPMTAPGGKAAGRHFETRRGGTSGKWAGLDTSRAPPPEQATLDKNVPSFLEKATAHMSLPSPPSVPPGVEVCPALIRRPIPN